MKINNITIEEMVNIFNDEKSFRNNIDIKIPAKLRYAIRINEEKIKECYKIYQDERVKTIQDYITKGYVIQQDGKLKIAKNHANEVDGDLTDLALIENDIDIYTVDKAIIENFLENVDISIPEEKMLLMFAKLQEEQKEDTPEE